MQNYVNTVETYNNDIKQLQTKLEELERSKKEFQCNDNESYKLYNYSKIVDKTRYNNRICTSCTKIGVDFIILLNGYSESHSHGRENYYYQDVEVQCCLSCYDNHKIKTSYNPSDYLYPVITENHF